MKTLKLVCIVSALATVVAAPTAALAFANDTSEKFELSVLNESQNPSDALPGVILNNAGDDLFDGSSRLLTANDEKAWVVYNREEELCLVVSESPETGSMTCSSAKLFNASGIGLQVWNESQTAVERYVVPDSVAVGGQNLITVDPASTTKAQDIAAKINPEVTNFKPRILPFFDENEAQRQLEP
ncbi:hypothetical protein ACR5KS_10765 [Leucobacter sp. W1153]|uniref:hypothetical protein n=1 Tax=Leucobacter sp. W1153 TaxID=3439064 RepID=UPI003F40DE4E